MIYLLGALESHNDTLREIVQDEEWNLQYGNRTELGVLESKGRLEKVNRKISLGEGILAKLDEVLDKDVLYVS